MTTQSSNDPEIALNRENSAKTPAIYKFPMNIDTKNYGGLFLQLSCIDRKPREVEPKKAKNKEDTNNTDPNLDSSHSGAETSGAQKNTTTAANRFEEKYHVYLPVPPGFQASYTANYGAFQQSQMARNIVGVANSALNGFKKNYTSGMTGALEGLKGAGTAAVGKAMDTFLNKDTLNAFGMWATGDVLGAFGEDVKMSWFRQANVAPRNVDTLAFEGMSLREWNMGWKIIPRSAEELKSLIKFRDATVRAMHPKRRGQWFFNYPSYFAFKFIDAGGASPLMLPQSSPCFMVSFNLTYNGSGNPTFFRDKEPVEYDLFITLRETQALSSESFDEEYATDTGDSNNDATNFSSDQSVARIIGTPR